MNRNNTPYHYLAWKNTAGSVKVGSYLGNSTNGNPVDNRNITGIGFQPAWVLVRKDGGSASRPLHRSAAVTGDAALEFVGNDPLDDSIQKLNADGFQVGTDTLVNSGNGCSGPCIYFYVALCDGENVATATPTSTGVLTNTPTATAAPTETATPVPTATDTPTETPPPSSAHTFQLLENALARGEITRDEAALYKVYALFGVADVIPTQFISTKPVPGDGTMLFLDALKDWEQLNPETQAQINTFITPKEITGTLPLTLTAGITAPQRDTAPPPKLGPGIYHLRGMFVAPRKARWQVTTTRGAFRVRINSQTILQAQGQRISADELKPGDQFDGIFQVTRKGRIIARKLRIIHARSETVSPRVQTSNQVLTTATAPWVNFTNLASGQSEASAPTLAVDAGGNTHAVWYAHTAPLGLYWSYKPRTGDWTTPQHIEATDETAWAPALAIDEQRNVYLAWEASADQGLEIRFVQKNWNAANQAYAPWSAPAVISAAGADGTDAEMGVTYANNEMQLHASWREMFCPVAEPCILRATYREWRRELGWQPLVVLSETTQIVDYAALAVSRLGRAAAVFVDDTCAGGHCAPLYYRQCDAAQTAGDCSDTAQWSAAETVSVGTALAPDLSFDTSGVAHLAWYGFANGGKSIFYSSRAVAAAQWSAPRVLATVTNNNNLELYPRIAAGTPNNVYLFWNDGVAKLSAPTMYYRQWDGRAWADLRPLSEDVIAYSPRWTAVVVDGNNVAHVAWRGKTDGILYADAPQVAREIGSMIDTVHNELGPVCLLTEYYETQNFRIYYTRTFPNTLNEHIEKDCSIQEPQRLNNAPNETNPDLNNPAFSGYPQYAVELGASLEKSSAQFSAMGYPVNRVPKDPSSDRYVVFITSSPIWTNNPFVGNIHSTGVTFPDEMYIPRTDQFNADNPIDFLRPQAAHEFFHAAQWTYVPSAPIGGQGGTWATTEDLRWWMEATATWSEPKVYSESGKYAADLDSLFSQPYLAMTGQPFANVNPRAYGSFIFASYLEQKVANTDTIIRQIWEKYQANNGSGGMIAAIDQVLQEQYATSLRNEFPKFTWNNYFLNDGTYTRAVNLYFDVFNPVGNPRAAPEWELFRSWLVDPRNNYQQEHAGVLTKPENSYPASGPQNYPSGVDALGSGYIEFLSPANVAAGTQLNVTLYTNLEPNLGDTAVQAYVIPILPTHFTTLPHPDGTLLAPQPSQKWIGTYLTQYTFHIENFDRCGRITLILNNVNTQTIAYRFEADLTQPPLPPNDPCLVRTP